VAARDGSGHRGLLNGFGSQRSWGHRIGAGESEAVGASGSVGLRSIGDAAGVSAAAALLKMRSRRSWGNGRGAGETEPSELPNPSVIGPLESQQLRRCSRCASDRCPCRFSSCISSNLNLDSYHGNNELGQWSTQSEPGHVTMCPLISADLCKVRTSYGCLDRTTLGACYNVKGSTGLSSY
jgi:hypothetical protein